MKRMRALNLIIMFLLVASAFLATPRPAYAAGSITVTNTKDDGIGCTLREAITAANMGVPYGECNVYGLTEINLQAGTYKLKISGANEDGNATGDLDIKSNLTIRGVGVSEVTGTVIAPDSNANPKFEDRILHIKTPGSTKINVSINNLRVMGGIVGSELGGGGILIENANVSLYRVYVTQNTVPSNSKGGGITNSIGSSLTVRQSTFYINSSGNGGGIYNQGDLTIENSLFEGNTGSGSGGGLDNSAAKTITVVINNTTITSNTSNIGSGIANTGKIDVTNATIANNVGSAGVALYAYSQTTMRNTIIARHNDGPNCSRLFDTAVFASNGYNLVDTNSSAPPFACAFEIPKNDLLNTNPLLTSSIDYYDSPTETYGFSSTSSPAIDKIPLGGTTCPVIIDQRLHGRGVDGNEDGTAGCDIGAFEAGSELIRLYMPHVGR